MLRHASLIALFGGIAATSACTGSASARFALANQTAAAPAPPRAASLLADGTSLRLKLIAAYLAEDVDPLTMNNTGQDAMIWLNPECADDISGCNVSGLSHPDGGPRVTQYFDLARPTEEVNAELNAQDQPIEPGTYRYARVEMCKMLQGETLPTVPMLMWKGPGMTAEQPFTSGDCGRTSLAFDPPLVIAAGDAVTISLGYDLAKAVAVGAPGASGSYTLAGHDDTDHPHWYRACFDVSAEQRVCMDYPDLTPTAARL
jgi:hypothetical protein